MKNSISKTPWAFILLAASIFSVLIGAYQVAVQSAQDISSYCATERQLPDDVDPYGNYPTSIDFGLFPLGFTCNWDIGGEPTTVTNPNWTVSALFYGGIAGIIVGAVGTTVFVRRVTRRQID